MNGSIVNGDIPAILNSFSLNKTCGQKIIEKSNCFTL